MTPDAPNARRPAGHGRVRRRAAPSWILAVVPAALAACGSSTATGASSSSTSLTQTVTVAATTAPHGPLVASIQIPGQDRFAPFTTQVAAGGTVTITNQDTDEHTVTSLPGAAVRFDVHIKSGETKTLQLPSGVFRYYCTIHARYVAATDQVAALPGANFPDQPMEGVISVG